jgi:hypothetical protein
VDSCISCCYCATTSTAVQKTSFQASLLGMESPGTQDVSVASSVGAVLWKGDHVITCICEIINY